MEDVAEEIVRLATYLGLEYFFLTGGPDLAPIQEALSKLEDDKESRLRVITVPHEIVSSAMALGYGMITGKPAVVGDHVGAGTSNALGNVMNAERSRIPLILIAGKTPVTEFGNAASRDFWIHWGQDVFDQDSIVREFVKWNYEIKRAENVPEVIGRAFKISQSPPKGPVYLTFSREILTEKITGMRLPHYSTSKPPLPMEPSFDQVNLVLQRLLESENPLIIAGSVGRNSGAVGNLVYTCEALGVGVSEALRTFMNFPTTNKMHVGFDTSELASRADFVLILDCMVPWLPSKVKFSKDMKIFQIDEDPAFHDVPMWSFPVDVQIQADSSSFLKMLRVMIGKLDLTSEIRARITRRKEIAMKLHETWRKRAAERAVACSTDSPMDVTWLSHELNRILNDRTILVNEYSLIQDQVDLSRPLSYLGQVASGYLGRGLGQALGAKLVLPDDLVVACVGDGSYIFSVPEAAHWVSNAYDLPFLTVIMNNQGWAAEKGPIDKLYPDGSSVRNSRYVGVDINPPGDYSKIVTAFGGYGEKVTDPGEIYPALIRAITHIQTQGKQAVLDVVCKKTQASRSAT